MIHCKMENDRIVAPKLPRIGEMIHVDTMGHAIVELLFHNPVTLDNFIKVEFQETVVGEVRGEHRFAIKCSKHNIDHNPDGTCRCCGVKD